MEDLTVDQAREFLKSKGFYVDNLWQVEDVQAKFKCDESNAQYILDEALTNEATMEQIWLSIDIFGEMEGLERVDE